MATARILQRTSDEFDERNLFLQASLGMISFVRRFERLIDDAGSGAPRGFGSHPATNDPCADLVLGLVAFTQRLRHHLEQRCAVATLHAHDGPAAGARPPPAPLPRDLLL